MLSFLGVAAIAVATFDWMMDKGDTQYLLTPLLLEDAAVRSVGAPDSNRVVYAFVSADCSFCRRIHPELQQLDNVRIYTFVLPGHTQEALNSARYAVCAADRAAAWGDVMDGRVPDAGVTCQDADAVERNRTSAEAIGLTQTPTLLRGDGRALVGYHTAKEIEQWLSEMYKPS